MTAAKFSYPASLRQVTEALWSDDARIHLSARQVGRVIDVLRVAADHSLHKRALANCPICDSYRRLDNATKDADGGI